MGRSIVSNCPYCGHERSLLQGQVFLTYYYIDYAKKAKNYNTFEEWINLENNPYKELNVSQKEKVHIYELLHRKDSRLVSWMDYEDFSDDNSLGYVIYYSPRTKKLKSEMKITIAYGEGKDKKIYQTIYYDKYRKPYVELSNLSTLPDYKCEKCKKIVKNEIIMSWLMTD